MGAKSVFLMQCQRTLKSHERTGVFQIEYGGSGRHCRHKGARLPARLSRS
jgi:hypothetical protein